MGDLSRKTDVEKLISYSDDLLSMLKDKKDFTSLTCCLEQYKSLHSSCDSDFSELHGLLQDHQKQIDDCKRKAEKVKLEVAADAEEVELLQKALEVECKEEHELMEELRYVKELEDLESQRTFLEEQKRTQKKLERDELRAERKLSMYASVTNIIPSLDEHSKITGHIVDRDKKAVEEFEFDPSSERTAYDTCQSIWKMINLQ